MILIEPYTKGFHDDCIRLFESNCPPFFDPAELNDLKNWLQGFDESYNPYSTSAGNYFYVAKVEGQMVGCAGFYILKYKATANMMWGMIDRKEHGKGYGKSLFQFRVEEIRRSFPEHRITLDTSQHTFRFFEKLGFKIVKITPNGYGEGLDRYDMA